MAAAIPARVSRRVTGRVNAGSWVQIHIPGARVWYKTFSIRLYEHLGQLVERGPRPDTQGERMQRLRQRVLTSGLGRRMSLLPAALWLSANRCFGDPATPSLPNMFKPASTPADSILRIAFFVLSISGIIFVVVGGLLVYSVVKFRRRSDDDGREPPQVYGSNQVELAWTVMPVLIVMILFLATARVIHSVQDARKPGNAIEVTVIGHQFWWEYRYPKLGVVTANELHVPVSDPAHPTPTFITLLSADTDHSFWVPRLTGKTDLIPNRTNNTWIDPHEAGIYLGQCAQYCGTQHAKMLLRVYVEPREQFDRWVQEEKQPAQVSDAVAAGRRIFETTACINCHAIAGTVANGRFGPDLTHLMSRDTIAAGAATNTPANLRAWIQNPDSIKPGSLMPAMQLSDRDLDALTAYLETLR
ncbi:MAG: cytochrome c oxidase subunit II [Candidatus Acidiferrales bacterium]